MSGFLRDDGFAHFDDECEYVCPACGEVIVVPVDASAGRHQEYIEDCPVCCHSVPLTVYWDDDGAARITTGDE